MIKERTAKLEERSIRILLENQSEYGSFIASPTFSQYGYSWLRDGSFIAWALLERGYVEETERFLDWCAAVIDRYSWKIAELPGLIDSGKAAAGNFLQARYALDGSEDTGEWPNFQIDGYGTWLWLVAEFCAAKGLAAVPGRWASAVSATGRYLRLVWRLPNSDCWEENPDKIHPSTLACVAGGLRALGGFLGDTEWLALSSEIEGFIRANSSPVTGVPKYIGSESVDSSLLWLTVPFGILGTGDELMARTVRRIEERLLEKGGVKRYPEDTYYGGGQWILLTAWLGLYYLGEGRVADAEIVRDWIVGRMEEDGSLPEQVLEIVNEPSMIGPWEDRWGKVASPLLWSHAMFLILDQRLNRVSR